MTGGLSEVLPRVGNGGGCSELDEPVLGVVRRLTGTGGPSLMFLALGSGG